MQDNQVQELQSEKNVPQDLEGTMRELKKCEEEQVVVVGQPVKKCLKGRKKKLLLFGGMCFIILLLTIGVGVLAAYLKKQIDQNSELQVVYAKQININGYNLAYAKLTYKDDDTSYNMHFMGSTNTDHKRMLGTSSTGNDELPENCIYQDIPEASGQIKFCDSGSSEIVINGTAMILQNSATIVAAYANASDLDPSDIDDHGRLLEELTEMALDEISNSLDIQDPFDNATLKTEGGIQTYLNLEIQQLENITKVDINGDGKTRRVLTQRQLWSLKKTFKKIGKSISKTVNKSLLAIKKNGSTIGGVIGAVVGFVATGGNPAGAAAGYKYGTAIGTGAQMVLQACYPGDSNKIKCSQSGLKDAAKTGVIAGVQYGIGKATIPKVQSSSFLAKTLPKTSKLGQFIRGL